VLETAAWVTLRDLLNASSGRAGRALALGVLGAPRARAARRPPRGPRPWPSPRSTWASFLPAALAGTSPLRYSIAPILALMP
jgi:hypothetical protein